MESSCVNSEDNVKGPICQSSLSSGLRATQNDMTLVDVYFDLLNFLSVFFHLHN